METISSLAAKLSNVPSAIISTHISPDSDAVGSSAALALGLASVGKEVALFYAEPLPQRYLSFISGLTPLYALPERRYAAAIAVDSAVDRRVGALYQEFFGLGDTTFNIDHHVSNDGYGAVNFIDDNYASTAEIVFELLNELNIKISSQMANLLYAGVADDTGNFRFSNTKEQTMERAARLIAAGAQPAEIANQLNFSVPLRVLKLRAKALSTLQLHANGRFALLVVSTEMLESVGGSADDTEGLVDEARSIEGVEVAALLRQIPTGWKASIRTKSGNFDANAVAALFGGGGHKAAAGATLRGSASEVEQAFLAAVIKHLD